MEGKSAEAKKDQIERRARSVELVQRAQFLSQLSTHIFLGAVHFSAALQHFFPSCTWDFLYSDRLRTPSDTSQREHAHTKAGVV